MSKNICTTSTTLMSSVLLPGWNCMNGERRWRAMGAWPRYEISNDALIRVRPDSRKNPGYILNSYWTKGSLAIRLYNEDGEERERRLYALMNRYWPNVEIPQEWKAERGRRPLKVSREDRERIKKSSRRTCDLAWAYDVSPRTIRAIKNEK